MSMDHYPDWPGDCNYPPPPRSLKVPERIEPAQTEIRSLACGIAAEVRADFGVSVEVGDWRHRDHEGSPYLLPVRAGSHEAEIWVKDTFIDGYSLWRGMLTRPNWTTFASFAVKKLEDSIREQMVAFAKQLPR